ncbi:MAG: 50S ribosomal protein L25 [Candidatus Paceibacterota bacterium]
MAKLTAQKREGESNNSLRKQGQIPAVVYGPEREDKTIKVSEKDLRRVYHDAGRSSLINLELDEEEEKVLIYEIQKHPVSGDPLHVDFYQPPLDKKIQVEVPLEFVGESNAVENLNGTLVRDVTRITVETLPQEIPDNIEVDISSLEEFSDDLQIKDLEVPSDVEILEDSEVIIASVVPPKDVEEELEEPIEEGIEEIETIEEAEEREEVEEAEEVEEGVEEEVEEQPEEGEEETPPQQPQ